MRNFRCARNFTCQKGLNWNFSWSNFFFSHRKLGVCVWYEKCIFTVRRTQHSTFGDWEWKQEKSNKSEANNNNNSKSNNGMASWMLDLLWSCLTLNSKTYTLKPNALSIKQSRKWAEDAKEAEEKDGEEENLGVVHSSYWKRNNSSARYERCEKSSLKNIDWLLCINQFNSGMHEIHAFPHHTHTHVQRACMAMLRTHMYSMFHITFVIVLVVVVALAASHPLICHLCGKLITHIAHERTTTHRIKPLHNL